MGKFRDLIVYKKSFDLAMEIYFLSKSFPKEEMYSLTHQIRRSSRYVYSSVAESYKKRKYPNHFISKLSDADMENGETQAWLDTCLACNYIDLETFEHLNEKCEEVSRLLNYMMNNHSKFL
ncbi:MAG: four helix bundle protein [Sphingobacteriales bacterium]|nr:four helix bundle protein [Sphingobacteriales bacterium]